MSLKIETVILEDDADSRVEAINGHARNFDRLGRGQHSEVFCSPDTPYVVKVMRGTDRGYLSYLKTAAEGRHQNSYMPRVFRAVHYRFNDKFYKTNSLHLWPIGHTPHDYFVFYLERLEQPKRRDWDSKKNKFSVDRFVKKLDDIMIDARYGKLNWNSLKPKHRDLVSTLLAAAERAWVEDSSILFDLHAGNVMKRGSQYVVTDPLN